MEESKIKGLSVRAILALLFSFTICAMAVMGLDVKEPLYTLGGLAVGFYFGQKTPNQTKP